MPSRRIQWQFVAEKLNLGLQQRGLLRIYTVFPFNDQQKLVSTSNCANVIKKSMYFIGRIDNIWNIGMPKPLDLPSEQY